MFFEMRAFKEYILFNDERRCIIEKIKERDSIYASDVILNKIDTIERCINRIRDVYDYKKIEVKIVEMIIEKHLNDFQRINILHE